MNYKSVLLPFGKTILQTQTGQSVSNDSAFLFEQISRRITQGDTTCLELGSGNGIISIMLSHYHPKSKITGIEFQPELAELSKKNAESAEVFATFINADLREYNSEDSFDLVFSNPPFFPVNSGKISPEPERAVSRHEIECIMLDVLQCVKRNLCYNGTGLVLYPANRESEFKKNAKKVDLKVVEQIVSENSKTIIFVLKDIRE